MKRKLLSLLVLLMTASTGAWAGQYLYLDNISGTTATLKCSDSAPNKTPYFNPNSDPKPKWENNNYEGDGGIDNFKSNCTEITIHSSCQTFTGSDISYLFFSWTKLNTINNIENLKTSAVTDMGHMFEDCSSLTALTFGSYWSTANVADMEYMFYGCSSLTTLDLSYSKGWSTSEVVDMQYMFKDCSSLTTLDLTSWNTSGGVTNVKNMDSMFYGCSSLTTLNLSNWNTSSVTDMDNMFNGCSNLESLDLTGWDTSSVGDHTTFMFSGCPKLEKSVPVKQGASGDYWATFYDATGYNYQAPTYPKAEVFKVNLNGTTIKMDGIMNNIVMNGQGVVLKASSADNITLTPTMTKSTVDYSDNSLKGTKNGITTETGEANNYYVLNKGTQGVGFYKLKAGGSIGANKAYLTYTPPTQSAAREYFLFDDEKTGIEMPTADGNDADAVVYDLQGRRVQNPAKGLYIVNGKKVVIK